MFDLPGAIRMAKDAVRWKLLTLERLDERTRRAILRDYRNGERVPLLARRYHLEQRDVWRVLDEGQRDD